MLVLVGPSASGKSAIVKCLTKKYGLVKFITCTTRTIRVGEVDGVDYHFLTQDEFFKLYDNDEFIETVYYNGNYYECAANVRWSRCIYVWHEADESWFGKKRRIRNTKSF